MFSFIKTKTTNRETEILSSSLDTWTVQWCKIIGYSYGREENAYQIFLLKEDAIKFKKSLDQANFLIGNTFQTEVKLYKQNNGLK
jgi:hypothetical protein